MFFICFNVDIGPKVRSLLNLASNLTNTGRLVLASWRLTIGILALQEDFFGAMVKELMLNWLTTFPPRISDYVSAFPVSSLSQCPRRALDDGASLRLQR